MLKCFVSQSEKATRIEVVRKARFENWHSSQSEVVKNWLEATAYKASPGAYSLLPGKDGELGHVLVCIADENAFWDVAALSMQLPEGVYHFAVDECQLTELALAWGLGAYQFDRYKKAKRQAAKLLLNHPAANDVHAMLEAIYLGRDLINTPAEDMGPSELAIEVEAVAQAHHANFKQIIGDELLSNNYPSIHIVGRACDDAPRLLDLTWGNENHPKVTLVGKGVCFDTGGLDLKPAQAMGMMKKDMGGAAHVIALAKMIMSAQLPIRLRVLIPAVENNVSANAYRPGDVLKTRAGLTVEVGNTDAEGRVVLADALAEAAEEKPELIIDMATLTGAARVAMGTDVPAMFSDDRTLIADLMSLGDEKQDPVWPLPLYKGYKSLIESKIADLNNCPSDSYGGAITAALFLQAFVPKEIQWIHFDMMAWNLRPQPGRPVGGEMMGIRTLFAYLQGRFK